MTAQQTHNGQDRFNDESIAALGAWLESEKDRTGESWRDISTRLKLADGTLANFLSTWSKGEYKGDPQRIAAAIAAYKTAKEDRAQEAFEMATTVPDFIATATAEEIMTSLRYAQATGAITAVIGVPGIGKTTTANQYRSTHKNVWIATAETVMTTPRAMLREIADVIGVPERRGGRLSRDIGWRLEGIGALLIIDEAQHLTIECLDQLRALRDKHEVGIALLGGEVLAATIDGRRDSQTAQIRSRLAMRRTCKGPKPADINSLISAWGVGDDKRVVAYLRAMGSKPGGLRNITMVMKQARLAQTGNGNTDITLPSIKAADITLRGEAA
ncbi:MAG: AAA family ATPase [Pseudomonadota bacterium]